MRILIEFLRAVSEQKAKIVEWNAMNSSKFARFLVLFCHNKASGDGMKLTSRLIITSALTARVGSRFRTMSGSGRRQTEQSRAVQCSVGWVSIVNVVYVYVYVYV